VIVTLLNVEEWSIGTRKETISLSFIEKIDFSHELPIMSLD